MAASTSRRRLLAVPVALLILLALAAEVRAYGGKYGGAGGGYDRDDDDLKERHRERVSKQAETYVKALEAVRKEEELAHKRLQKGEQKARSDADGDDVKEKRAVRLARHKAIEMRLRADAKYARLFVAVQKFKAEEDDYFTGETKARIEILVVQIKDQARSNRKRIADLYVDVEQPVKALKMLEAVYQSLSPNGRAMATDLRGQIKALRTQLGLRDDDAGR